jgi:hypothetical protein
MTLWKTQTTLERSKNTFIEHLGIDRALSRTRVMDKESWIRLLESAGLDQAAREKWHSEFERMVPDAHQDFLESLGIPSKEIALIRNYSKFGR